MKGMRTQLPVGLPALNRAARTLSGIAPRRLQGVQLQRKGSSRGGQTAPPSVAEVLRSSGERMDGSTRSFMESRMGHDFSQVSVHTGARAAESARAVQASAYTFGNHIVFGSGAYAPGAPEGRRLLAHELTHVAQQQGSPGSSQLRRQPKEEKPFAGSVPNRKLPEHKPQAPRSRRAGSMSVDGFPVAKEFCGCEDSLSIAENRVAKSEAAFRSCFRPGMLIPQLYACARDRIYAPLVGKAEAANVPSAAHTESSSGAIEWPSDKDFRRRMDILGHREQCWPIIVQSVLRHELQHVSDFDEIAKRIGARFFAAFKELEGDPKRLEKLREKGFRRETDRYELLAVNSATVGPTKALQFELKAYVKEKAFLGQMRTALQTLCAGQKPAAPQPSVPRPEIERPEIVPLWPTIRPQGFEPELKQSPEDL